VKATFWSTNNIKKKRFVARSAGYRQTLRRIDQLLTTVEMVKNYIHLYAAHRAFICSWPGQALSRWGSNCSGKGGGLNPKQGAEPPQVNH